MGFVKGEVGVEIKAKIPIKAAVQIKISSILEQSKQQSALAWIKIRRTKQANEKQVCAIPIKGVEKK